MVSQESLWSNHFIPKQTLQTCSKPSNWYTCSLVIDLETSWLQSFIHKTTAILLHFLLKMRSNHSEFFFGFQTSPKPNQAYGSHPYNLFRKTAKGFGLICFSYWRISSPSTFQNDKEKRRNSRATLKPNSFGFYTTYSQTRHIDLILTT